MADFEAGIGTVLRLRDTPVDVVVVVVEPTAKSLEVGRRAADTVAAAGLGQLVVTANRVRDDEDRARVQAAFQGLTVPDGGDLPLFVVPDEPAIVSAERAGVAVLDAAPGTPGVLMLVALAEHLAALA